MDPNTLALCRDRLQAEQASQREAMAQATLRRLRMRQRQLEAALNRVAAFGKSLRRLFHLFK